MPDLPGSNNKNVKFVVQQITATATARVVSGKCPVSNPSPSRAVDHPCREPDSFETRSLDQSGNAQSLFHFAFSGCFIHST